MILPVPSPTNAPITPFQPNETITMDFNAFVQPIWDVQIGDPFRQCLNSMCTDMGPVSQYLADPLQNTVGIQGHVLEQNSDVAQGYKDYCTLLSNSAVNPAVPVMTTTANDHTQVQYCLGPETTNVAGCSYFPSAPILYAQDWVNPPGPLAAPSAPHQSPLVETLAWPMDEWEGKLVVW